MRKLLVSAVAFILVQALSSPAALAGNVIVGCAPTGYRRQEHIPE
jgi:hypothetical protein